MSANIATPRPFISVDWGTSSLRAYRIDAAGEIADRRETGDGILSVGDGDFASCLLRTIGNWLQPDSPLPVVMSGMIGSRQGWREVPYVACPASRDDLAAGLVHPEGLPDGAGISRLLLVPGLTVTSAVGVPDVIRGEECQIFGALDDRGGGSSIGLARTFLLPGTHSKWATADGRTITGFRTYMTGELFAAALSATILGKLAAEPGPFRSDDFARGVAAGASPGGSGALLNRLFSGRTLALFDKLEPAGVRDYLSGMLIGAEVADAAGAAHDDTALPITIIASDALAERYERALTELGYSTHQADPSGVVFAHAAILAHAAG
ncbi:MAG: 2-dehydro-3-deoxygalactonokinase [Pseudomonadota bacterium]